LTDLRQHLVHIVVSSANTRMLVLTQSGKSFTNNKNNRGQSTDPCGTSLKTLDQVARSLQWPNRTNRWKLDQIGDIPIIKSGRIASSYIIV